MAEIVYRASRYGVSPDVATKVTPKYVYFGRRMERRVGEGFSYWNNLDDAYAAAVRIAKRNIKEAEEALDTVKDDLRILEEQATEFKAAAERAAEFLKKGLSA